MERTLILVKPDGVQRSLVGTIISKFEGRGLKLIGLKMQQLSKETAEEHYGEHKGKPFYDGLVNFITSGPLVAMAFEGDNCIEICRSTIGATNPVSAGPGTIRGDFAVDIGRNVVHGSDGPETAERELNIFFKPEELVNYEKNADTWVRES